MNRTKKILTTTIALVTLAIAGYATAVVAGKGRSVETDSMIGVPLALTGSAGQIRGINGGGAAWSIGAASAEVSSSGKVEVAFRDLIFASGPNAGKNTLPSMRVVVSCLDANGATVNVATDPFPVTTGTPLDIGGDGRVEAHLALPSACLAPMVFVTNAGANAWFAVDGL
jgi:hypothetical protein